MTKKSYDAVFSDLSSGNYNILCYFIEWDKSIKPYHEEIVKQTIYQEKSNKLYLDLGQKYLAGSEVDPLSILPIDVRLFIASALGLVEHKLKSCKPETLERVRYHIYFELHDREGLVAYSSMPELSPIITQYEKLIFTPFKTDDIRVINALTVDRYDKPFLLYKFRKLHSHKMKSDIQSIVRYGIDTVLVGKHAKKGMPQFYPAGARPCIDLNSFDLVSLRQD